MSAFRDIIYAAAPRNRELLHILSKTKSAVSELTHQQRHFQDLEKQVAQAETRCIALEKTRRKELKDHIRYRDSVVKRFAYRVSGQSVAFDAKAQKEESEYLDVLKEAQSARIELECLVSLRDGASRVRDHLADQVAHHDNAQRELDTLYDALFTEAPALELLDEEILRRRNTDSALEEYHSACVKMDKMECVMNALNVAMEHLYQAATHLDRTFRQSEAHLHDGAIDSWKDKRILLQSTNVFIRQSASTWKAAKQILPLDDFATPPPVRIAGRFKNRDILDDLSTDRVRFHDIVKAIQAEVTLYHTVLEDELARIRFVSWIAKQNVAYKSITLKESLVALRQARELVFEKVINSETISDDTGSAAYGEENPPLYHA
ncbi:hypothetical protein HD806DRAFT_47886 [Xylariaceae sp. AK1471]|nr:hypothetical protein HD806DRAFT_47886 [Xylariaceae sp. AK1471]